MARKIDPNAHTVAPPPQADTGADDLDILHPERTVTVGGKLLTVREYGFREGLELQRGPAASVILNALVEAAQAPSHDGLEMVLAVLAEHPDELFALIAQAADVAPAWLADPEQVSDTEGQALLMTWWLVNSGFFVRRVVRRLAVLAAARAQASAGATSTPASSGMDTTASGSASTPVAS